MGILDHVWGESAYSDRVWAQVVGLRNAEAERRLILVWQACVDESFDDGVFAIAGWIATASQWDRFSREWEELLPLAYKGKDGRHRFKMSEMAASRERMEDAQAFYRVIEKHLPIRLSFSMQRADLIKAARRLIWVKDSKVHAASPPNESQCYGWAWSRLVDSFHKHRHDAPLLQIIPENEKMDFIFDNRSEKKLILESWDRFIAQTGVPERFGATPRFEDEEDFLPLQAADFLVWWVRKWTQDGLPVEDFIKNNYPWDEKRGPIAVHLAMNEDEIAASMASILRAEHPDEPVFDLGDGANVFHASYGN